MRRSALLFILLGVSGCSSPGTQQVTIQGEGIAAAVDLSQVEHLVIDRGVDQSRFLLGCVSATQRTVKMQGQVKIVVVPLADLTEQKIPLPGLGVSLGMSVDEVAYQLQHFEFQHTPEKQWQKNGHSFYQKEAIVCSDVSLSTLNEQLEHVHFTFDRHELVKVSLTIFNVHNALKPLIESLQLVENKHGVYHGLDGSITMRAGRGNAEKTTWTISRN